jgi:hypothetical protein
MPPDLMGQVYQHLIHHEELCGVFHQLELAPDAVAVLLLHPDDVRLW